GKERPKGGPENLEHARSSFKNDTRPVFRPALGPIVHNVSGNGMNFGVHIPIFERRGYNEKHGILR
ncbi:MAG: hypothetical protein LBT15_01740, partial [Synergistaceae bacterium]|nr:hypothetical protein [Synergistaceae bacterium]